MSNKRPDTGFDCCICKSIARVTGDGFTWCKKHWEEFDLGRSEVKNKYGQTWMKTIAIMRDNCKTNVK